MKSILEVHKYLIDYLKEIIIEDYWGTEGNEDDKSLVYDIHYNGKASFKFIAELDRILYFSKKELEDLMVLEDDDNESIFFEIEELINELSKNLVSQKSLKFLNDFDEKSLESIYSDISEIISKLQKYKYSLSLTSDLPSILAPGFPLQWNEKINKLADLFYQLSVDIKNGENKPLIETSKPNLTKFLLNNFVDKEGKKLKFHTISTVLSKERNEKRPSPGLGIVIRYLPTK